MIAESMAANTYYYDVYLDISTLEDGTTTLFRSIGTKYPMAQRQISKE
jgi:hypothetical protein